MSKIVCMVPAKGYSERVRNKNLRTLGNKSLVEYVLDTLESVDIPVYLNSDSEDILKMCEGRTCIPYKRDSSLCTDESTNDDFMLDFMLHFTLDFMVEFMVGFMSDCVSGF